jgi:hypothetical protein
MPRHSSTDVAIAAAHDLAQALLSPSPSSTLSPITDRQRHQLLQLSSILLQHTARPDTIPNSPPLFTITQAPPAPLTHSHFPVPDNSFTTTPSVPRVAPTSSPLQPNARATVPRVEPTVTSTPPKRITWAPSVTGGIAPIATYQTATINPGQRRHRATTAQKASADRAAFLSASITIHTGIKSHTWTKRRSASRRSYRRCVRQPLPATHINHLQSRAPHTTITSHVASFAAKISAIANTF